MVKAVIAQLPVALTVAGSDPSGGAGIQADLKTFHQFGVYGEAVVTLVTVQNTRAVSRVEVLDAALVAEQIAAVVGDIPPRAAKTGALGNAAVVRAVAQAVIDAARSFAFPLVVDPVMISKHGAALLDEAAIAEFRQILLPLAALVTPNLPEAAALAQCDVATLADAREAARRIHQMGPRAVLIKGGHFAHTATDLLYDGVLFTEFPAEHRETVHTHGTGCTYSAAITAGLAHGLPLLDAVGAAKRFIDEAIRTSPGLGSGQGPVNHFAPALRSVKLA
jgi:hydroxymethylpyrimidine/phosphomethylpyrimidine kinase